MDFTKALAIYSLGSYVVNLDYNLLPEENKLLDEYKQKLVDTNPLVATSPFFKQPLKSFQVIRESCLSKLSLDDLNDINKKLYEIIKADGVVAPEEEKFLKGEWIPYLKERESEYADLDEYGLSYTNDYSCFDALLKNKSSNVASKTDAKLGAKDSVAEICALKCATLLGKTNWQPAQAANNLKN